VKVAYFDCPSGASGDMILGALVDAGLSFEALREDLGRLPLTGYTVERREVLKGPFRALKIDVRVHDQSGSHGHPHRRLGDILDIVERSSLPASVCDQAASIFRRLAEAEGRVHGTPPEDIHFHEVGAVDAIVDITGACIGLARLGVEAVHCSALPIGGGLVDSAHGRIPIPAPGTAELLRGMALVDTGVRRELVTPTGAAILSTLARSSGSMPAMTVDTIGYGAGTIDLPTPNVIRLFVGEARAVPAVGSELETICQIETTVDDMSPQLWEPVIETLFEAGALDVYLAPVIMKRSRPGVGLTALCEPARVPELTRTLLEASTTIGVRWTTYQRRRLPREMVSLGTAHGPISFKVSRLDGRVVTVTPEFEEVRRIARDKGLPVREVLECARAEGRRLLDP
jgi:pyridinium-3,5-bisthiocarboxylic acid mononucleotide nickel chelatase